MMSLDPAQYKPRRLFLLWELENIFCSHENAVVEDYPEVKREKILPLSSPQSWINTKCGELRRHFFSPHLAWLLFFSVSSVWLLLLLLVIVFVAFRHHRGFCWFWLWLLLLNAFVFIVRSCSCCLFLFSLVVVVVVVVMLLVVGIVAVVVTATFVFDAMVVCVVFVIAVGFAVVMFVPTYTHIFIFCIVCFYVGSQGCIVAVLGQLLTLSRINYLWYLALWKLLEILSSIEHHNGKVIIFESLKCYEKS